jgi:FSR family fosmidomycin resistance protein-like MFS transporter
LKLLLLLAFAHVVVDTIAFVLQPLWPDLRNDLALSDAEFQASFVLWSLANSVLQLPIGYWAERRHARWLIWAGPALGAGCICGACLVESFVALCLLLVVGGVGIAAFHPEAAAAAAACAPENRSRALSIFAIGGYVGQALGPLYAGKLTAAWGRPSLAWTLAWGWAALALVAWGLKRTPLPAMRTTETIPPLGELLDGKKKSLAWLAALGVLRVTPGLGVPLALAFAIKDAGGSNADVGFAQSLFLAAIGSGSMACALFVRRHNERTAFWALPLLAALLLAACPIASPRVSSICAAAAGFALGVTFPLLVSCGQQLLPRGQRIASGLTMGVTWGLASPVAISTIDLFERWRQPAASFYVFAGLAAASSLMCLALARAAIEPAAAQSAA